MTTSLFFNINVIIFPERLPLCNIMMLVTESGHLGVLMEVSGMLAFKN